jgi:hypothetical protein
MIKNNNAQVTQKAFGCFAKYAARMAGLSFSETYTISKNNNAKSTQLKIPQEKNIRPKTTEQNRGRIN